MSSGAGATQDNITGGCNFNDLKHLDLNSTLSLFYGDEETNPYIKFEPSSKFWDITEFSNCYKNSNHPLVLNINIQSLLSKFEHLKQIIEDISNNGINIIAITVQEIWRVPVLEVVQINDFTFFNSTRKLNRGGGVGIYVRNGFSAKINKQLSPFLENIFECLSID